MIIVVVVNKVVATNVTFYIVFEIINFFGWFSDKFFVCVVNKMKLKIYV